jgi:hypothetical protein
MIMMASLIAIFGYQACSTGRFQCDIAHFPDISHLMGGPPLNKLYAMMLTAYSMTKQAEARAYHDRLSSFVSPTLNNLLLVFALMSFICGPGIGFFDCYYNMDWHMWFTGWFTFGEIFYVVILVYVIHTNRTQFQASTYPLIDRCMYALGIAAIVGLCMHFNDHFPGVNVNQIGEWIAFYMDFFCRYNLAMIIKYRSEVVPSKNQ